MLILEWNLNEINAIPISYIFLAKKKCPIKFNHHPNVEKSKRKLMKLTIAPSYLGTRRHVTQIIIAKKGVERGLFWIAKDLYREKQSDVK